DNTGPEKVTGLSYTATAVTVTLRWNDVSDNDFRFFRVERKNAETGQYTQITDVYTTLGANIYTLSPDTEYIYRVVAYDHLGNRGIPSDDITTRTDLDVTCPVITSITPQPGYFAHQLNGSIRAEDDHAVSFIAVQISTDLVNWIDVDSRTYATGSRVQTLSFTIDLDPYPEGFIYVRGVAADPSGNVSDLSGNAPYVQHVVDRTPPEAPANVAARGDNGYIEISWSQGSETDLFRYSVYRSLEPEDGYVRIANSLNTLNYIDRTPVDYTTYYYKVSVNDLAGNESALSNSAEAQSTPDTEAPIVYILSPADGATIGNGYKTLQALARDNRLLSSVHVEYAVNGSDAWTTLALVDVVNAAERYTSLTLPIETLASGDSITVRTWAVDAAGNTSEKIAATYSINKHAPSVLNPAAVYDGEEQAVHITWQSDLSEDLAGYRIYRGISGSGSFSLIGSRGAVNGQTDYSYSDYGISAERTLYAYRITAVSLVGNEASFDTNTVETPNRTAPVAVISCDTTMEVGVEYEFDASLSTDTSGIASYEFDFGDGTVSANRHAVHRYESTGAYVVTLKVTNADGLTGYAQRQVTVRERSLLGYATIRVVDGDGRPVPGAPVYFDLGEANQIIKPTNSAGYVTFSAEAGSHTVGSVIADNQWLPAKKTLIVVAGQTAEVTLTLVRKQMIEGFFEIHRMSLEEIVAAGIDISDPANQYIVKFDVYLKYGNQSVPMPIYYNPITGTTDPASRVVIDTDGEGSKLFIPFVFGRITEIGGGGGSDQGGNDAWYSPQNYSVAYLVIPVGVSALKDFFQVDLHIINNAGSEFRMLDNVVTLNYPKGLTLVDSLISSSGRVVRIPEIGGQTEEVITWVLRGDELGSYHISADFIGMLAEFNVPITAHFAASEPIQVLGLSGVEARVEVPDSIRYCDDGWEFFNLTLLNHSDRDIYMPNIWVRTGEFEGENGEEIKTELIYREHFDSAGAAIAEQDFSGRLFFKSGISALLEDDESLRTLKPGERFTAHYRVLDQDYLSPSVLLEYFYVLLTNSYGLEITILPCDPEYFGAHSLGDGLYWSYKRRDQSMLIYTESPGNGTLPDNFGESAPWQELPFLINNNAIRQLKVDNIGKIGENAFKGFAGLTTLAASAGEIGTNAFKDCTSLTFTSISSREIGDDVLLGCNKLNSLSVSGNIHQESFRGLSSVTAVEAFGTIDDYAFRDYANLESAFLSGTFGSGVFEGCGKLQSLRVDGSIPAGAFRGMSSLKTVHTGNYTSFGAYAFENCSNIETITIVNRTAAIATTAFSGCDKNKLVIRCYENSTAHSFALQNGYKFELLPESYEKVSATFTDLNQDTTIQFEWSLEYFFQGSLVYENKLAIAGLILSAQSENSAGNMDERERKISKALVNDLGLAKSFSPDDLKNMHYRDDDRTDAAFTIAATEYVRNGEKYNIITVVVKGTTDGKDWEINLTPKEFERVADRIYISLRNFMATRGTSIADANNRFFITGHSLGGAVAGLLAVKLMDSGASTNQVFAYTFASPLNASNFNKLAKQNIKNILNKDDIVIHLSPEQINGAIIGAIGSGLIGGVLIGGGIIGAIIAGALSARHGVDMFYEGKSSRFNEAFYTLTGKNWLTIQGQREHFTSTYMAYLLSGETISPGYNGKNRLVTVYCPVDVEVYNASGELVGAIVDNAVACAEDPNVQVYAVGDTKLLYFTDESDYAIKLIGTDEGEMAYVVRDFAYDNDEATVNNKVFESIALTPGKTMTSQVGGHISTQGIQLFVLDEEGQPALEIQTDGTEIPVAGGGNPSVSISAAPVSYLNRDIEYTLSIANAKDVLAVSLDFEIDGNMLISNGMAGLSGFELIGNILWFNTGGNLWKGSATIALPSETTAGLTSEAPVDIAKFAFAPKGFGNATMALSSVKVSGILDGTAGQLASTIGNGTATTVVARSKYDLNRDGIIDALDLGIMLLYCGFDCDGANWDKLVKVNDAWGNGVTASMCDVNSDGLVDMLDLIDLFIHYTI
ncbi:MAG: leucine-rich repeat protein, partial [Clostridiales bacterium]|nr:leucine-rich repeat protein [Clostridiales bacterium]